MNPPLHISSELLMDEQLHTGRVCCKIKQAVLLISLLMLFYCLSRINGPKTGHKITELFLKK